MTDIPAAEWEFYSTYYLGRVIPKLEMVMADCEGLSSWLAEHEPELNAKISAADDEISSIWLSRGEKAAFHEACKSWYRLLVEAKKRYDDWKAKKRQEALLVGRQEALTI